MNLSPASLLLSGALACLPLSGALAQAGPVPSASAGAARAQRLAAVADMLDAMGMAEAAIAQFKAAMPPDPARRDMCEHFLAHVDRAELLHHFATALAGDLTEAQARAFAAAFRTPVGRTMVAYQANGSVAGGLLTAQENARVNAFGRTRAGQAYRALQDKLAEQGPALTGAYFDAYYLVLYSGAVQAMAAERAAHRAAEPGAAPRPFVPVPTGVSHVDAIIGLLADLYYRNGLASWQFDHDLTALGPFAALSPATLAAGTDFPHAREALDQAERLVERYLTTADANLQQFDAGMRAIELPGRAGFSAPVGQVAERQIAQRARFAEQQRAMIGVMRRILALAEANKGKLVVRDGGLLFPSPADAATYHTLMQELEAAAKGRTPQA